VPGLDVDGADARRCLPLLLLLPAGGREEPAAAAAEHTEARPADHPQRRLERQREEVGKAKRRARVARHAVRARLRAQRKRGYA
jgi:hypothetical protein